MTGRARTWVLGSGIVASLAVVLTFALTDFRPVVPPTAPTPDRHGERPVPPVEKTPPSKGTDALPSPGPPGARSSPDRAPSPKRTPAPDRPATKYALLVGVNEYQNRKFENLKYAERDVSVLAQELRRAGFAVRLLLGSAKDQDHASRANIEGALEDLLNNVTKRDMVLVALAGHGLQMTAKADDGKERDEAFFCPPESVLGRPASMLGLTGILKHLDERGGDTNLLLVDACRNDPDPNRGRGIDGSRVEALPEGVAVLFSCSRGQRAFESANAGGGHGVFFHFVIQGLRGEARNQEGEVTWQRLAAYITEQVEREFPKLIPNAPQRQVPHVVGNLAGSRVLVANVGPPPAVPVPPSQVTDPPPPPPGKNLPPQILLDLGGGVKLEFVLIRPGTFLMGSPRDEKDRDPDEDQHQVTITKEFYVGKYEVTRGQFRRFADVPGQRTEPERDGLGGFGFDGSQFKGPDYDNQTGQLSGPGTHYSWRNAGFYQEDGHPVVNVTWNDAKAFCDWLRRRGGKKYRLPTEAEWEYACRAGSRTRFSCGDDFETLARAANFGDATFRRTFGRTSAAAELPNVITPDGHAFTAAVGQLKPNGFGLYDMHGNVWEWCEDWYGPYDVNRRDDPTGPAGGTKRVQRGGSWDMAPRFCRSAHRGDSAPVFRGINSGFRVVWVPD